MQEDRNVYLPVKTMWFNMTNENIKTEDYREINEHWFKRLVFLPKKVFNYYTGLNWEQTSKELREQYIKKICTKRTNSICFKPFVFNVVTLGYPSALDTNRIAKFMHLDIVISTGKAEWGAEPNKLYFVIKHGEKI